MAARPPNVKRSVSTWSVEEAPTVEIHAVHEGRDYAGILQQTKLVYDQLLHDKHSKLFTLLLQQKAKYDTQCDEMARRSGTDSAPAMEFSVRAQEALNKLQAQCSKEMAELQQDYQNKLLAMQHTLEDKWKKDHAPKGTAPPAINDGPPVACKIYPHKN